MLRIPLVGSPISGDIFSRRNRITQRRVAVAWVMAAEQASSQKTRNRRTQLEHLLLAEAPEAHGVTAASSVGHSVITGTERIPFSLQSAHSSTNVL